MLRAGIIGEATCSDISPGMLATLETTRGAWVSRCRPRPADAERLPFPDESFDLVLGHAVLHHIPDLARAFAEFERVLAPGGTLLFAGEPSRYGDRLAGVPKRMAVAARAAVAPRDRRARQRRRRRASESDAALEGVVDVHAFAPGELPGLARDAGLIDIRVSGEELLANWFGWTNRTLEASAEPEDVPWAWRQYAHRGYLLLQGLDRRLLEPRLPAGVFYNLMLAAREADLDFPHARGAQGLSAVPAGDRGAAQRERAPAHLRGSLSAHDREVPAGRARLDRSASSASSGCLMRS